MEKRFKLLSLGIAKVIGFVISVYFLRQIVLVPLSALSAKYWSRYDGRGLNEPWFFTSALAILLATLFICFVFIKYFDKKQWGYIRLSSDNKLSFFFIGISVSFFIIVLFTTTLSIFSAIELKTSLESPARIALYLTILPIGGFALAFQEELIYRGYILKTMESISNKFIAITASSFLFSLAHILNPNTSLLGSINIFLVGGFLAIVCVSYNSLWIATGIHVGWNFFLWLLNFPVSGQVYPNPIFSLNYKEYSLLSGSKFGPEDSIFITFLLIIFAGYFFVKFRKKLLNSN